MDCEVIKSKIEEFFDYHKQWTEFEVVEDLSKPESLRDHINICLRSSYGKLELGVEFRSSDYFILASHSRFSFQLSTFRTNIVEAALDRIKFIHDKFVELSNRDGEILKPVGFERQGFMRYDLGKLVLITNYEGFDSPPWVFGFHELRQIYGKRIELEIGLKELMNAIPLDCWMTMNQEIRDHAIGASGSR